MTGPHTPVMLREVVEALAPKDGEIYVDATFGAGGYSRAILEAADCTVFAFDRDQTAIERASELVETFRGRLTLIHRPFAEMAESLAEIGVDAVDGVVFDLGVSSMQLDEPERGFSFRHDGPLSMRMDGDKPDAADVVALADEATLKDIFKTYGEERKATRIARAIVAARGDAAIETTASLAGIVERAAPDPKSKIHPATRVFQALRIFVNDEIGQLIEGLAAAERLLRPAGRLVVVAFHSLEDRIVKRFLASRSKTVDGGSRHAPPKDLPPPTFDLARTKSIAPGEAEVDTNPRARSAKLRVGKRRSASPLPIDFAALGAPRLSVNLSAF